MSEPNSKAWRIDRTPQLRAHGQRTHFNVWDTASVADTVVDMRPPNATPEGKITIREAFPELPEEKEAEAEACLARYLALVYRLYERIREDPRTYAAFQRRLTELASGDSMRRSSAEDVARAQHRK